MYNDFVIIGPRDDPANISESKSTEEALNSVFELGYNPKKDGVFTEIALKNGFEIPLRLEKE